MTARAPEQWKPIPWPPDLPPGETPPYEASTWGNVRSVARTLTDGRDCGGANLRLGRHNRGYLQVKLRNAGVQKTFLVHKLVLWAFDGPPPLDKPFTRHLDDDPANNYWAPGGEGGGTNLVYGTEAENVADRLRREAAQPKAEREGNRSYANVLAGAPVVLVEDETQRAVPAANAEAFAALKEILDAGRQVSMSPPATSDGASPVGRWARLWRRYTPWSRKARTTPKTDSNLQKCDQ